MATPSPSRPGPLTYLVLGVLGLAALGALYFACSYLAVTLFLALDQSVYGQLPLGGWVGYALLGLGLGAAGGAVAAQRRYRLHRGVVLGSAGLAAGLVAAAVLTRPNAAPTFDPEAPEAAAYTAGHGRVTCGACTRVAATTTRPAQNGNSYEAANLLRRDSTKAWISAGAVDAANPLLMPAELQLAIAPLAGHRLVGLRLRNGYCKTRGVYQSFGRVQALRLGPPAGPAQAWTLPDDARREYFVPVEPAPGADSTRLVLRLGASYPGTSHAEVALAWLVPVFEPLKR